MTLRVAVVTEFCPPYRTGFYESLARRYDLKVFFTNTKESWRAYGDFDYAELSGYQFRERYKITPTVFTKLRRFDPDVIVGAPVEGFGGQSAFLYSRITDTPFVLWTGEWHLPLTTLRTVTFPLIRRIYHGSDAIAVYGPHTKEYLADLGVETDKISIAWNTVDTDRFAEFDSSEVAAIRERWDVPSDATVGMFVGRLVKEKGVKYLIDAYEIAREELDDETYLFIVGDGDQKSEIERKANDLPNVIVTGYVDNENLPEHYALADTLVLPSIITAEFREPWGLVVNEAMSAGTSIIATGQVGAAAAGVVRDGENGFVVPERNVEALADRLATILGNSTLASRLGETAAEDIAAYDFDRMVSGIEEAIETALRRREN